MGMSHGEVYERFGEIKWYWLPNYIIPFHEDAESMLDQQWAEKIGMA